jgi:CheY-like chemotaxis protein
MDIQMPEMDGLEATRQIRESDWGRTLPIIAMTAAAFDHDRKTSQQAGMNAHVSKPIDTDVLLNVLLQWIPGRSPDVAEASAAVQAPQSTAVLPLQIEGIDLRNALNRLAHDRALLVRLIRGFARDFGDWESRLRAALADDDLQSAVRLAHTLKGAAGNIGATQLQTTAGHLEAALAHGNTDAVDESIDALTQLLITINNALPPQQTPQQTGCFDAGKALSDLEQIENLLKHHRLVSATLLKALASHLGNEACHTLVSDLEHHIDPFDMSAALATASKLRARLIK